LTYDDGGSAQRGGPVAQTRRHSAEEDVLARVDELLVLWRLGRSTGAAASTLGLPVAPTQRVIARHASDADRAARRANLAAAHTRATTYSDHDIVRALRRVATDLGRAPHAKEYGAHARRLGCPSLPTVLNRMGSWTAALRAAGLAAPAPPHARSRRWTADACWTALRRATFELDAIPTVAGYDEHARDRDDLPSPATIRNRLGRWSVLTAQLVAERDGAGEAARAPQT
jgi:hypothetical protein